MDALRFDRLSKALARRRSRYAMAQEATPESPAGAGGRTPELLFVQTFRAGAIAPKAGTEGRFTLTLEAGHGQTIYFSDRPDRVVGATPTAEFVDRLGFPDDNPPNAALVFETAPGKTDVAVVELYSPVVDEAIGGVTYEVAVLENWEELDLALGAATIQLAAVEPSFGMAHLFIDGALDCPNGTIECRAYGSGEVLGTIPGDWFNNFCSHGLWEGDRSRAYCVPCGTEPSLFNGPPSRNGKGDLKNVWSFWGSFCNERIPACNGNCRPSGWCEPDPWYQNACPDYR